MTLHYPYFCAHPGCANVLRAGGACSIHSEWYAEQLAACTDDPTYGIPNRAPYEADDGFHFPPGYGLGLTPDGEIWAVPGAEFMRHSHKV